MSEEENVSVGLGTVEGFATLNSEGIRTGAAEGIDYLTDFAEKFEEISKLKFDTSQISESMARVREALGSLSDTQVNIGGTFDASEIMQNLRRTMGLVEDLRDTEVNLKGAFDADGIIGPARAAARALRSLAKAQEGVTSGAVNIPAVETVRRVSGIARIGGNNQPERSSVFGGSRSGELIAGVADFAIAGSIIAPFKKAVEVGSDIQNKIKQLYATAGGEGGMSQPVFTKALEAQANKNNVLPSEAATSAYPITSAGFKGADALTVLNHAERFTVATQGDMQTSTDLLSKALVVYRGKAGDAARFSDIFTRAISDSLRPGKEFTPALESVMEVGRHAGLSMVELSSALSVMTSQAKSASVGATNLKAFLGALIDPTMATRKAAEAAGLGWLAQKRGLEEIKRVGFEGVMQEINRATNGNSAAMATLFPDLRKVQAAFGLLNDGGVKLHNTLKDVGNSSGATTAALQVMQSSLSVLGGGINSRMETLDSTITGDLNPSLVTAGHIIEGLITGANNLSPGLRHVAEGAAAVTAGIAAIGAAARVTSGAWNLLYGPEIIGKLVQLAEQIGIVETANKAAAVSAEELGTAEAGAATETAAAGAGFLAVGGPIAIAVAAIAGLVIELGNLKNAYDDMRTAQDQAAVSAGAYQGKLNTLAAGSVRNQLTAIKNRVTNEADDLDDAIKDANPKTAGYEFRPVAATLADRGYDVKDNLNYQTVDAATKRRNALRAALPGIDAQIKALPVVRPNSTSSVPAPQDSSGLSNSRVLSALSDAHQSALDSGLDKLGSCAEFASRVFTKAGVQVASSMSARQLESNVIAAGGTLNAQPKAGDVVFFHGKKFGVQKNAQGIGEHVGFVSSVQNGVPLVTNSSSGRVKYGEKYSQKDLKGATFYTLPDQSVSDLGAPTTGTQPAWVAAMLAGNKKTHAGLGRLTLPPLPSFDSDTLPLDFMKRVTDAATFAAKRQALTDSFSSADLLRRIKNPLANDTAAQVDYQRQQLALANNAAANTGQQITRLTPGHDAAQGAARSSGAAFEAYHNELQKKLSDGGKITDEEQKKLDGLAQKYDKAKVALASLTAELKRNTDVYNEAVRARDEAEAKIGDGLKKLAKRTTYDVKEHVDETVSVNHAAAVAPMQPVDVDAIQQRYNYQNSTDANSALAYRDYLQQQRSKLSPTDYGENAELSGQIQQADSEAIRRLGDAFRDGSLNAKDYAAALGQIASQSTEFPPIAKQVSDAMREAADKLSQLPEILQNINASVSDALGDTLATDLQKMGQKRKKGEKPVNLVGDMMRTMRDAGEKAIFTGIGKEASKWFNGVLGKGERGLLLIPTAKQILGSPGNPMHVLVQNLPGAPDQPKPDPNAPPIKPGVGDKPGVPAIGISPSILAQINSIPKVSNPLPIGLSSVLTGATSSSSSGMGAASSNASAATSAASAVSAASPLLAAAGPYGKAASVALPIITSLFGGKDKSGDAQKPAGMPGSNPKNPLWVKNVDGGSGGSGGASGISSMIPGAGGSGAGGGGTPDITSMLSGGGGAGGGDASAANGAGGGGMSNIASMFGGSGGAGMGGLGASAAQAAPWIAASLALSKMFGGQKSPLGRAFNGGLFGAFFKHSPIHLATGGSVPGGAAASGKNQGDGDTVPAMLTPGEFVLSKPMLAQIASASGKRYEPDWARLNGGMSAMPQMPDKVADAVSGAMSGGSASSGNSGDTHVHMNITGDNHFHGDTDVKDFGSTLAQQIQRELQTATPSLTF